MTTAQERLNNFEVLQETLEFILAGYIEKLRDEKACAQPDENKINALKAEYDRLDEEMHSLYHGDDATLQQALEKYAGIAKAEFEKLKAQKAAHPASARCGGL